jgi:uncharacterized radical SAM superfamily protein
MKNTKILLLHPPASNISKYQLDGYCSQPQKGIFRWHPIDFIALSSRLKKDADISILDLGHVNKYNLNNIRNKFDYIIGLIGAYGFYDHVAFYSKLLQSGEKIFLSGDISRYSPLIVFDQLIGLQGIIPELSVSPSVNDFSEENSPKIWRPKQYKYILPVANNNFLLGIQNFNLWNHKLYHLPFPVHEPFASVISQVGCPYNCHYCILSCYSSSLRNLNELEEELKELEKSGVKHIYIRDATLNSTQKHLENICEIMTKFNFTWNAFARIDNIGANAKMLYDSGCRILQFGIDSIDSITLINNNKKSDFEKIEMELNCLKKAKVETVGHFIFGLENHPISPMKIAEYAHKIELDWLTITPFMLRPGIKSWNNDYLPGINDAHYIKRDDLYEIKKALIWFYSRSDKWKLLFKVLINNPLKFFI